MYLSIKFIVIFKLRQYVLIIIKLDNKKSINLHFKKNYNL